jgi:hypothetical protein
VRVRVRVRVRGAGCGVWARRATGRRLNGDGEGGDGREVRKKWKNNGHLGEVVPRRLCGSDY